MKSIVFAILLYFVCASITCNKPEKNEISNTASNTVTVHSATCKTNIYYAPLLNTEENSF
jgi:hypothetical protein